MTAIAHPVNQAEIFARSLGVREPIPSEVARFFINLELAEDDRARLDALAAKARQGSLTPAEQQDLDEYRRLGRLVELMKLKAQNALRTV